MGTMRNAVARRWSAFEFEVKRRCARRMIVALGWLDRGLVRMRQAVDAAVVRLSRYDHESRAVIAALTRGGSSEEFDRLCAIRRGAPFDPMTLEHGVTHNKNHDAFQLEPAISSEPLSKAELEAMARALSGGSTEHLR